MSSDVVIRLENLSKAYCIYAKPQDRLKQMLWRGRRQFYREFWALQDVNLEIRRGETLGIIGSNGSGKSTLLQLIVGILPSTQGLATVSGRVAALLELGIGFNPEFTGRENVFVAASVMGLQEAEIEARYRDIVEFSGIGDFIDQPVKVYSSGMYARLAFAVATHVDPDILIVDEALSVGDFTFQQKSLQKIHSLIARGCATIMVSHDLGIIQNLCSRVVYLDHGRIVATGNPLEVCARYQDDMNRRAGIIVNPPHLDPPIEGVLTPPEGGRVADGSPLDPRALKVFAAFAAETRQGGGEAKILNVLLQNSPGPVTVDFDEPITLDVFFTVSRPDPNVHLAFYVIDRGGQLILGSSTIHEELEFSALGQGQTAFVRFRFANRLRVGEYGVTVILFKNVAGADGIAETKYLDYVHVAARFICRNSSARPRWALYNPHFDTDVEIITHPLA